MATHRKAPMTMDTTSCVRMRMTSYLINVTAPGAAFLSGMGWM